MPGNFFNCSLAEKKKLSENDSNTIVPLCCYHGFNYFHRITANIKSYRYPTVIVLGVNRQNFIVIVIALGVTLRTSFTFTDVRFMSLLWFALFSQNYSDF